MKRIVKKLLLLVCLFCCHTAFGQTYQIGVGETLQLNVPSVSLGYVDKAIWACTNPAITFVNKSEISATIKANRTFDGYAAIELVYVEKYVDQKGFTRAITYTKNYYVSCVGSGSGDGTQKQATSISIQPELKVEIGGQAKISYQLYPEGSTADVRVTSSPGTHFNGLTSYKNEQYVKGYARSAGIDNVTVYFYDENDNKISSTCVVTVYDPTWIEPENIDIASALLLHKGEEYKILPLLSPRTATTLYEWKTDNNAIASVSQGTVKAKDIGITDVSVTTSNGLLKKCSIIVVDENKQLKGADKALERATDMLRIIEEEVVR